MRAPSTFDFVDFAYASVIAQIAMVPAYFAFGFVKGVFGICTSASPGFTDFYLHVVPWFGPPLAALIGWRVARARASKRDRSAAPDVGR